MPTRTTTPDTLTTWLTRWRREREWTVRASRGASPGLFIAYSRRELASPPSLDEPGDVFGTNGAGLLFVLDRRGRVILVDDVERSVTDGQLLAPSLDAFAKRLRASQPETSGASRPESSGTSEAQRYLKRSERRLHAFLSAERFDRVAVDNTLIDVGNALRLLADPSSVDAAIERLRTRSPERADGLARKLRRYVKTGKLR